MTENIKCPYCGGGPLKVVKTENMPGNIIRRSRKCAKCGKNLKPTCEVVKK